MCKHIKTKKEHVVLNGMFYMYQVTCLKCGRSWLEKDTKVHNPYFPNKVIAFREHLERCMK